MPPRERGRPARILIPLWRLRSVGTILQAGSHPVGVNCKGKDRGDPRRRFGSIRVAQTGEACRAIVRAGRPRSRAGAGDVPYSTSPYSRT